MSTGEITEGAALAVSLVDGALEVVGPHARLGRVLPRVGYEVTGHRALFAPVVLTPVGDGAWRADDGRVELVLTAEAHAPSGGLLLTATATNLTKENIRLDHIDPLSVAGARRLELGAGPGSWSVYRNGWGSWSNARSYRLDESDPDPWLPLITMTAVDPETPRDGAPGHLRSEQVMAVQSGRDGSVVIGFVRGDRAFGVIDVRAEPGPGGSLLDLSAASRFDLVPLAPGATIASEPLLLAAGADGVHLLESWADAFGLAQHARVPARPPHGWCSWYYYFTKVDEADVRENLAEIEREGEKVPFDYVMVDDGHQVAIGDWLTTNGDFPSGMADLARRITETGRDAGIWLAPFIAEPESALLLAHPDWVIRDDRGRPRRALWNPLWNRRRFIWALDTTRPDVQEWLTAVAHTIRHDWGYRVLKLDFLYAAALPGVRHDPNATRAMALRAGLEAVRAGAGEDAVLIGCGLPFAPAVGMVDCMRIGTDVAPIWSNPVYRWATTDTAGASTRVAVRNTLTRAFMHGRLWANDPDCVMVRTDRTRLTLAEVRSLAVACALTDGMIVSSDRLSTVPVDRIDLLALAHTLNGGKARVVDLFDQSFPELVVSERDDDVLVGVFNFADHPRALLFDLERCGVADLVGPDTLQLAEVLDGGHVPVRGTRVDCGEVGAHDCRVVRIPRRGRR